MRCLARAARIDSDVQALAALRVLNNNPDFSQFAVGGPAVSVANNLGCRDVHVV